MAEDEDTTGKEDGSTTNNPIMQFLKFAMLSHRLDIDITAVDVGRNIQCVLRTNRLRLKLCHIGFVYHEWPTAKHNHRELFADTVAPYALQTHKDGLDKVTRLVPDFGTEVLRAILRVLRLSPAISPKIKIIDALGGDQILLNAKKIAKHRCSLESKLRIAHTDKF